VLNGVGVAGVVILGILLFRESPHPWRLVCVAMILIGIVGLRLSESKPNAGDSAAAGMPLGTELEADNGL